MYAPAKTETVRCAVYTRKSTDEGLDQAFNSLDAQREAGEAFIASRKHEGWVCLADRYDDGGFSGGNVERPAIKRLMADIEAGRIDAVVCYKVDRLSRSLLDFSRLIEVFDRHRVMFISVTQPINTADSGGRLMLNVLLSFAQFEREMIADRTRDKVSAARRKGKWTGGVQVLGYDVHPDGGSLVVNEDEAAIVRQIFDLYLELGSIQAAVAELNRRGLAHEVVDHPQGRVPRGRAVQQEPVERASQVPAVCGQGRASRRLVRRGAPGDRRPGDVRPRPAAVGRQQRQRRGRRQEPVRPPAARPAALRGVRVRHDAERQQEAGAGVPVLRLRQSHQDRVGELPVPVAPGQGHRGGGRRPDQGHRPGPRPRGRHPGPRQGPAARAAAAVGRRAATSR
jgi:DNA invertase Pin-like site-specific DNA recombinase